MDGGRLRYTRDKGKAEEGWCLAIICSPYRASMKHEETSLVFGSWRGRQGLMRLVEATGGGWGGVCEYGHEGRCAHMKGVSRWLCFDAGFTSS